MGVKESAGVNVLLAVVDFLTQLLLVLVGLFLVFSPQTLIDNVHLGVAPTWKDFFLAIPVGMIAYTGIETISNMAEEAKDETKTIPAAINRVVIAVFAIYALLPMVALSALPVTQQPDGSYSTLLGVPEDQGGFAGDPVLGVVKHLNLGFLQQPGEIYVGLLAATILFIATNAGIIGVSRLVYSMGLHRQVPDRLRQLHPQYGTPWIGILLFGTIACLAMIPGEAEFLGNMYAFGAMLSFTIAHISVIRLRKRFPDFKRPWTGPGNIPFRGYSLPLFAVFGGLGTGLAFVVVTALHVDVALAGIGWLALGCLIYPIYRHRQGLDLTSTVKVAIPAPVVDHEAEYESILVALDGKTYPRGGDGHGDQGRRAPAPRHPRARHHPGAGLGADRRRAARARARRADRHRAGQAAGRTARDGPLGEGARGRRRPADRRGGPRDGREGDRHAAARHAPGRRCSARRWRPCSPSGRAGSSSRPTRLQAGAQPRSPSRFAA